MTAIVEHPVVIDDDDEESLYTQVPSEMTLFGGEPCRMLPAFRARGSMLWVVLGEDHIDGYRSGYVEPDLSAGIEAMDAAIETLVAARNRLRERAQIVAA